MLVREIFNERIIPFPEQLWRNERSHPDIERFLLGFTAAAMVFSRDFEDFAAYLARELWQQAQVGEERLSVFWEQLKGDCSGLPQDDLNVQLQRAMRSIPNVEEALHGKEAQLDQLNVQWQRELFGSPAIFLEYVHQRGFSESGKGSLAERIMQGRICGQICLFMAASGKSLKESIALTIPHLEEWRDESKEIREVLPTLSLNNIQNSIWPKFKDIAWLWSGFSIENPIHDGRRLMLEETNFYRTPLTDAFEVHRGRWWGFMDFTIRVFNRLYGQDLQSRGRENTLPWRFSFQISKKDDSSNQ